MNGDRVFDECDPLGVNGAAATAQAGRLRFVEAHHRLGHFENRSDLLAVELAVLEELQVRACDLRFLDLHPTPHDHWAIGGTGQAFTFLERGEHLRALLGLELLLRGHDQARVRVIEHEPLHELLGGVIGLGGQHRHQQGRHAAPVQIGIGRARMNDFTRRQQLRADRRQ